MHVILGCSSLLLLLPLPALHGEIAEPTGPPDCPGRRQVSSVKVRHLDPEWGETFDLPVATEERGGPTTRRNDWRPPSFFGSWTFPLVVWLFYRQ